MIKPYPWAHKNFFHLLGNMDPLIAICQNPEGLWGVANNEHPRGNTTLSMTNNNQNITFSNPTTWNTSGDAALTIPTIEKATK